MSPASHLVQVPARPVTCPGGQGRRLLADWLARADVQLDGPRPHDPQIRRLWRYYLLTCAGAFRARANQLWQLVMSPSGVTGGYRRPEI